MKHLTIQLIVITLTSIASSSCSSMEDAVIQNPYISNLANTGCISHWDSVNTESRSEVRKGSFEMFFDGQTAECRFISLDYPCDFWKVNVRTIYSTGTLMIIEYSTFDEASCRCKVDASFTIENIPQNEFVLKIYHGDTNGNYNKTTPKYEGRINPAEGKIMIPY